MNVLIKRMGYMIGCCIISTLTGFGMFCHYQIGIPSLFFNMKIGMFISATMMIILSSLWNYPPIVKEVKGGSSLKKGR